MPGTSHIFSVAPMIDWTDRHCRYFHRSLSRHARLYTEMITDHAVLKGDREYLLGFDATEHPVALQLGGSDPERLAAAAQIGAEIGYDEINLNVGCPSDKVQSGTFGACLMKTPGLVAECFAAMEAAVDVPVTVKCRIGVDDQDPENSLREFVGTVAGAGCQIFIVHARKAWLQGLSPKENRDIPPLDYGLVAVVKRENPELTIVLNGGIANIDQGKAHLENFDGVMLGRAAYERPWLLSSVDEKFFGEAPKVTTRQETVRHMSDYLHRHIAAGGRPHQVTRHMLGLFHGRPGARRWRQFLTIEAGKPEARADILDRALAALPDAALEEVA